MANMYAFADTPDTSTEYRGMLKTELSILKQEYDALLYGGTVATIVSVFVCAVCVHSVCVCVCTVWKIEGA